LFDFVKQTSNKHNNTTWFLAKR